MNEKKLKLIDKGLTLFAEKGYHATSIQEIAKEAGISKGAFYLYFQSKEDFIVRSIDYIHEKMTTQLAEVKSEPLKPRETLEKQIAELIGYIDQYKGFITMYLTESISIGDRMDALIKKMEMKNFNWMREVIAKFYGDKIGNLTFDAMVQFEGIISGYVKWMIVYNIKVDPKQASEFIVRRLDSLISSMIREEDTPLITEEHVGCLRAYHKQTADDIITVLKGKIATLPVGQKKQEQLIDVIDTLQTEKDNSHTKPILLQGLLAHFGPYPVLHEECQELADLWNIELL